jgi:hypothetical protein
MMVGQFSLKFITSSGQSNAPEFKEMLAASRRASLEIGCPAGPAITIRRTKRTSQ